VSPEELAVLDANSAFYRAFARKSVPAMEAIWADAVPVTCVHPGWDAIRGRDAVMESWRSLLEGNAPDIRCGTASAQVAGSVAWVLCRENIPGAPPVAATNVFVKQGGEWRICHHHAGLVAEAGEERPPSAEA
jgi:ketosteroid isomerase-like protein